MAFKTIDVPGHGEIDFPDTMTDDAIATAIRVNILGGEPVKQAAASTPKTPADPMASRIEDARTRDNALSHVVTDEDRAQEAAGTEFRQAQQTRNEDRRKAIAAGGDVPAALLTPGQYASEKTGIRREEPVKAPRAIAVESPQDALARMQREGTTASPLAGTTAKATTAVGDIADALTNITSVPLVTLLRSKTYSARLGEKVLEAEAGLKQQSAIRKAKAATAPTDDDKKAIEGDKFLNQLHSAYQAVKENPTAAGQSLIVGLLEDAPLYMLAAPVGGELVKLVGSIAKEGQAAARLAKLTEKIGATAAAESEAASAALGATEQALVKQPVKLGHIVAETAKDAVGDVGVGAVTSQARGQDYNAGQLAQDLVASGVMAAGGSLLGALSDGRPLTAAEFEELGKAVERAGLEKHPQVLELLPKLQEAARNEKFTGRLGEGEKIAVSPEAKALTGAEARAAYGAPAAAALGLDEGADIKGVTEGNKITLQGTADAGTVDEEMANFWVNALKDDAAKAPDSPEAKLLADIEDHVEAIRRENATLPARQQIPLPKDMEKAFVQMYLSNTKASDVIPGMENVELPKDLADRFTSFGGTAREVEVPAPPKLTGKGFTKADMAAQAAEAEAARVVARDQAAREGQQRIMADAAAAEAQGADARAQAAREGQIRMMGAERPAGLLEAPVPPKRPLGEFLPEGLAEDIGKTSRPPLAVDESPRVNTGTETTPQQAVARMRRPALPGEVADVPSRFELPSVAAEDAGGLRRPLEKTEAPARALREFLPDDVRTESARQARRPLYQLRARKGTPARAESDRLAAVDAARMVAERKRPEVAAALKKMGYNEPERQALIARGEKIAKMTAARGWSEAVAQDALTGKILKAASETIKQTIGRNTDQGIRGTEVVSAREALRSVIRRLDLEGQVKQQRQAMREGLAIRKELAKEARALPAEVRGKMLSAVATAKSAKDLAAGLRKADEILGQYEHSQLVREAQDLLSTDASKMRPEYRDSFNEIMAGIQRSEPTAASRSKIADLAAWYEKASKSPDFIKETDLIPKELIDRMKTIEDKALRSMDPQELRDVVDAAKQIIHENALKNEIIGMNGARDLKKDVETTVSQIEKATPPREDDGTKLKPRGALRKIMDERASPELLLSQIGGKTGELLRAAYHEPAVAMSHVYQFREGMRDILKAWFQKEGVDNEALVDWRNEKVTVPTSAGEITLTRPQLVSLYANAANRETLQEILEAGIVQDGRSGDKKRAFKITREDLNAILARMTDFDIGTADAMMKIFESARGELNRASEILHGYEKFNTENYFPRYRDRSVIDRELTDLKQFYKGGALEGQGFTKTREKSDLPVIIPDAMRVFDKHINDIAMYSEMAVPIRNALRLTGNNEVSGAIRSRFGDEGVNMIESYLKDVAKVNPPARNTMFEKTLQEIGRMFATGKLGLRVTTMANNLFGAPAQIWGVVDEKYGDKFLKNMTSMENSPKQLRATFDEMAPFDGYFVERYSRDPFNTVIFGPHEIAETVGASKNMARYRKMQNFVMKPIQDAEKVSAIVLYKTIRDNTSKPEAVKGMTEILGEGAFDPNDPDIVKRYAAHKTMLIVRKTQNALDDLDKSAFSRDLARHPMKSVPYVFTSQLFKLQDMARMAFMDIQQSGGWSKASPLQKRNFDRTMASVLLSGTVIPTGVAEIWNMWRNGFQDKDEREEAKRMGPGWQAAFSVADMVSPELGGGSRMLGAGISGKTVPAGRGGFISESVSSLVSGIQEAFKDATAEDGESPGYRWYKKLVKASTLTGAPLESISQAIVDPAIALYAKDPALPLLNERFLIRKKAGVDKVTQASMAEAVSAGKITSKDLERYYTLDAYVRATNEIKKSGDKDAIEKIKKLVKQAERR